VEYSYEQFDIMFDISEDDNNSTSFQIPRWVSFVGLSFLTDMVDADIALHVSFDNNTFFPVIDPADGNDLVVIGSGDEPGFVDISDYVRAIIPTMYVRLYSAANQTSDETVTVTLKG
jgi:hypothetical protein